MRKFTEYNAIDFLVSSKGSLWNRLRIFRFRLGSHNTANVFWVNRVSSARQRLFWDSFGIALVLGQCVAPFSEFKCLTRDMVYTLGNSEAKILEPGVIYYGYRPLPTGNHVYTPSLSKLPRPHRRRSEILTERDDLHRPDGEKITAYGST